MSNNTRTKHSVDSMSVFSMHSSQIKLAFIRIWHRPLGNLLTLAVIAMALSLPASVYVVGKNIAEVTGRVVSFYNVSAYIQVDTPEARIMELKDKLESWETIEKVQYISSQQGLNDLSEYSGFEQAISLLSDFSLPAVLIIQPLVASNTEIKEIVQAMRAEEIITDIRLDEDWLARLDAMQNLAIAVAGVLSVLMLGSVFLIVGNTLRFTILAHKEEIQVMKLIGATDGFILRPYLYFGMWFGLIGAVIAWLLTAIIMLLLSGAVETLAMLYDSQFSLIGLNWNESLLLLALGFSLGYVAANFSARKHLKEIEPI